jgi:hypothetical protein
MIQCLFSLFCLLLEVNEPERIGIPQRLCVRVLSYVLIYAPTEEGCLNVTNEINAALILLAEFYVEHFLCTVYHLRHQLSI